ncbi:MAG: Mu-like prophage major head subunit gpT family protein [Acidobacteriota bacterium]
MAITDLQILETRLTPIALDAYLKSDPAAIIALIGYELPSTAAEGKVKSKFTVQWPIIKKQLERWVGERKTGTVADVSFQFGSERFHITDEADLDALNDESTLLRLDQVAQEQGTAYAIGEPRYLWSPCRDNHLCWTGQNFFDTGHPHLPGGSETFDNLFTRTVSSSTPPPWALQYPTPAEVVTELEWIWNKLVENALWKAGMTDLTAIGLEPQLAVMCYDMRTAQAFEAVARKARIQDLDTLEQLDNPWYQGFRVVYDPEYAGLGNALTNVVDYIWAQPNGPRPVLYSRPIPQRFRTKADEFDTNKIFFGPDGKLAYAPGFPQSAIRVQPPGGG